MPDTRKHVRIVTGHPGVPAGQPAVLVDGELLKGVTQIGIDHSYADGMFRAQITMVGVDVDLEAAPDYLVKVVGPSPSSAD